MDKDLEHRSVKDVFDKHEFVSTEISDILNNRPLAKQSGPSNDFNFPLSQTTFSLGETQAVNNHPQTQFAPQKKSVSIQQPSLNYDFSGFGANENQLSVSSTPSQQGRKPSYNLEAEETVGPKWKKQTKTAEPVSNNLTVDAPRQLESQSQGGLDFDFSVQSKPDLDLGLPKNKVLKLGGSKKIGDGSKAATLNVNSSDKLDAYFGSQAKTKPPVNFEADFI